jgi:hypothetical protein
MDIGTPKSQRNSAKLNIMALLLLPLFLLAWMYMLRLAVYVLCVYLDVKEGRYWRMFWKELVEEIDQSCIRLSLRACPMDRALGRKF